MPAWIGRSIAPRGAARGQSALVASSTQERFRRELCCAAPARRPLQPGMVVVAAAGARRADRSAPGLPRRARGRRGPAAGADRARRERAGHAARAGAAAADVPALLPQPAHLAAGSRTSSARSTPTPRSARDRTGELNAIDHFEQAVVPVPVRRIVIWFAVSVIFSAVAFANIAQALARDPLTKASKALRESVSSVFSLDPERADRRRRPLRRRQRRRRRDRHHAGALRHLRAADHLVPAQADAAQPLPHRREDAGEHGRARTTSPAPAASTGTSARRSRRSRCRRRARSRST